MEELQKRVEFLESFVKSLYVTQMGYSGSEEVLNKHFKEMDEMRSKLKEEVEEDFSK